MSKFRREELVLLNLSRWNVPEKYLCSVIEPKYEGDYYSLKLICRKDLMPTGYIYNIHLGHNVFKTGKFLCSTELIDKLEN